MDSEQRQGHWQRTYREKAEHEVSWTQDSPEPSLTLVTAATASLWSPIIDVGGGSSPLIDQLVDRGYRNVSVLDVSAEALAKAQARVGERAETVDRIVADITAWTPTRRYQVWHDRATFHFMVADSDRAAYLSRLKQALAPGGHAIIATFDLDGPEQCSGLPVMRYDPARLADTLGPDFMLIECRHHQHQTPWGAVQPFQFSVFKRRPETS